MTSPPKILLDCDPGIDDMFAILCALRFAEVAAVTTVSGNVSIEHTTRNARWILELSNRDEVPVYKGAAKPLEVEPYFAREIHGTSGLGEFNPPEPRAPIGQMTAAEAIILHCESNDDPVIVATGPLTNLAEALLAEPALAGRISHLHWMGGSAGGGNTTELAEFNAWVDPHAVEVTLEAGLTLSMYGLDLTKQVRLDGGDVAQLRDAGTPTSKRAAEFLDFYRGTSTANVDGKAMHDPCAVLGTTHPDLFARAPSRIVLSLIHI